MFRWPVEFTPLSLSSQGRSHEAILELTPRGATFTLAALSHVGHPTHLALIDAYLRGQVRLTPTASIGEDSRIVAASLAAPLLAAFELGVERLSLADIVLLPTDRGASSVSDRAADGHPTFTVDSPRLLLRTDDQWHWVHGAERFEAPGCLGTRGVGLADQWHRVIAQMPDTEGVMASARAGRWPAPILAEVRAPAGQVDRADPELVASIRTRAPGWQVFSPRLRASRARRSVLANPSALVADLVRPRQARRPTHLELDWQGLVVDACLVPDLDGSRTLHFVPPAGADPSSCVAPMRDLAWETIEGLIGRPLPERRTEPIELRLVGEHGRVTVLGIGASVVIGRNQTVFAAWVGSDGRVMIKLLPPGGMPIR